MEEEDGLNGPDLPDGDGKVVQVWKWTRMNIICWGGLRPGGSVTVHLPAKLMQVGNTHGGTPACMKMPGIFAVWTVEFGYEMWEGAVLCKRCFDKNGTPRGKFRPAGGWFRYTRHPLIEKVAASHDDKLKMKVEAVRFMLSMEPKVYDDDIPGHIGLNGRVVEA